MGVEATTTHKPPPYACSPHASKTKIIKMRLRRAEMRRVEDDTSQATRNDTSARKGDDPAKVDPGDHAPVDGPPRTSAETDTDSRTRDTLGG